MISGRFLEAAADVPPNDVVQALMRATTGTSLSMLASSTVGNGFRNLQVQAGALVDYTLVTIAEVVASEPCPDGTSTNKSQFDINPALAVQCR